MAPPLEKQSWIVEWCNGGGVPKKELFIGQDGQGQIRLISLPHPRNPRVLRWIW